VKIVPRGKFISMIAYIKKSVGCQIKSLNDTSLGVKQEQAKTKISGWKEIIKTREEINGMERKNNSKNQ
jgi:hypothetical protein